VAHPGPKVYLTVILELINESPAEWIGIRLENDLIDGIINTYLRTIGAIVEPDDEEPEQDDPGDDTVASGQNWTTATGAGEI